MPVFYPEQFLSVEIAMPPLLRLLLALALTSIFGAAAFFLLPTISLWVVGGCAIASAVVSWKKWGEREGARAGSSEAFFLLLSRICQQLRASYHERGFMRCAAQTPEAAFSCNALRSSLRILIILFGLAAWWWAIVHHATLAATRSPWLVLPPVTLLALGVAAFAALTHNDHGRRWMPLLLLSTLALTPLLFPLGYGFDPFLHRATIAHLLETGTIIPKPPYYIGAYILELLGSGIARIPLLVLDTWLAPILLTLCAWLFLSRREHAASPLVLLLLPFSAFLPSTPHAVALVWLLLVVILTQRPEIPHVRLIRIIVALAALATHPLPGIPALALAISTFPLPTTAPRWTLAARTAGIALATLGVPTGFLLRGVLLTGTLPLSWNPDAWRQIDLPLTLSLHGDPWRDLLTMIGGNLLPITLACAVIGIMLLGKQARATDPATQSALLAAGCAASALLLAFCFDFSFLPPTERGDFATRLFIAGQILLLPAAGIALTRLRGTGVPLAGALVLMSSVYMSVPRHDAYARSAGFTVGSADIMAVRAVDARFQGAPYVVLTNQATAAAALQEFGFVPLLENDIFYYPLPTGGPLYAQYLRMVDGMPSCAIINHVRTITGAQRVAFIVSDFWWRSTMLRATARSISDDALLIENGAREIFFFDAACQEETESTS